MTQWVVLDPEAHRSLEVATHPAARFGDEVGMVAAAPIEFSRLIAHYPIFFRKNGETGQFEPAVMLGFSAQENLFLDGERWSVAYAPLQVQRQPFRVAQSADVAGAVRAAGLAVTVDMDSPRLQPGQRIFDDAGAPTAHLTRMTQVLGALVSGARAAFDYPAHLARLRLIEPLTVEVEFVDGSPARLQGLYSINPEALQALPGADLIALRDLGYLEWAYVQIASLAHLSGLIARKNQRLTQGQRP